MTARPHLEFAPPPAPGLLRAMVLAILAHAVLLVMLSVGVQWKSEPLQQAFEAELWASVPVEAAPPAPLLEPEPPEPPKPAPPEIKPKPEPKPVPPPPSAAELKAEADIALAKEKEKLLKEKKLAQEKLELEKKKLAEQEQKKLAELEKKKQAELDKQKQAKLEQDKKDKEKKDKEKLAADKEKDKRLQDQKEAKALDEQRQKAIKRMEGLAGAGGNGAPGSTSSALEAKSLSSSYAGRIRSYIKRFHTYTDTVSGNPTTEIEVRLASDGTILSRRIAKASGTRSWDEAALNAIDKAEKLPLDENGRAPSPMTIVWSAQEVSR